MALLPYLEEEKLYKEFRLDEPWDSEHNKKLLARMPTIFRTPGDKQAGQSATFYRAITGKGAVFDGKQVPNLANAGANTLLIVEAADAVPWTKPDELHFAADQPLPRLGLQKDEFHALFADGHVAAVETKGLDEKALRAKLKAMILLEKK